MAALNADAWRAAQIAGGSLGVSPDILYAQFAGETGNFSNSGTAGYNYAGIQAPGKTSFSGPADFANYFTRQIEKNYPAAMGAGNSVTDYVGGLTNGKIGTYYAGNNNQGQPETQAMYANMINSNLPSGTVAAALSAGGGVTGAVAAATGLSGIPGWIDSHAGNWGIIILGGVLILGALLISQKDTVLKVASAVVP
jgi:hypothetical protein